MQRQGERRRQKQTGQAGLFFYMLSRQLDKYRCRDGRTGASGPTDDKEICASPVRADVGTGPYGVFTDRIL